jgi:hypothetical protein
VAAIIAHIPKRITYRHGMFTPKTPPSDSAELLRLADALSLAKFGVPALLLSIKERELLLAHVGRYLAAEDAMKGRAS